jgi:hypothetical protein
VRFWDHDWIRQSHAFCRWHWNGPLRFLQVKAVTGVFWVEQDCFDSITQRFHVLSENGVIVDVGWVYAACQLHGAVAHGKHKKLARVGQ